MKCGIRNNSLKMDWDDAYAVAGEIGFDGVEICVTKPEHMPRILEAEQRQRPFCTSSALIHSPNLSPMIFRTSGNIARGIR